MRASDLPDLFRAIRFATAAHEGQRRRNRAAAPYVTHPLEVVEILCRAGVADIPSLVAAVLHDVVEDTTVSLRDITETFGPEVGSLVDWLTDPPGPRAERKAAQVQNADRMPEAARLIKLADQTANLRDIPTDPPEDWDSADTRNYIDWCSRVGRAHAGLNPALDRAFEDALKACRNLSTIPPPNQS